MQGVGPKVAARACSAAGPRASSSRALAAGDVARLQAVPGIGKRTAERIVVELREKVGVVRRRAGAPITVTRGDDPRRMARDGLLELGFAPAEADALLGPPTARAPRSCSPAPCGRRGHEPRAHPVAHPHARAAARARTSSSARCARAAWRSSSARSALREQLGVSLQAAAARGEALDHVLLAGPPGLGKTSLAQIVAAELDAPFVQTAGPALERKGDVAALLTALEPRAVFFVDEIHRLNRGARGDVLPGDGGPPAADHDRPGARGRGS